MINVKQALKQCNRDRLIETYLKYFCEDCYTAEQRERLGQRLSSYVDKVTTLRIVYNRQKWLVINTPTYWDEDDKIVEGIDSSLIKTSELTKLDVKTFDININLDDFNVKTKEGWDKFLEVCNHSQPVTYAYELDDANKILGFLIPDCLIEKYGLEWNCAAILQEMTWFGFDVEDAKKERDDFRDGLIKSCEEIKAGTAKTVPWEDVKKDLEDKYGFVDDRTADQIEDDKRNFRYANALGLVEKYKVLTMLIKEVQK